MGLKGVIQATRPFGREAKRDTKTPADPIRRHGLRPICRRSVAMVAMVARVQKVESVAVVASAVCVGSVAGVETVASVLRGARGAWKAYGFICFALMGCISAPP